MKKHIPNLATLGNLLSGVIGIVWVSEGAFALGAYMILLGNLFDFFDGLLARLLKVSSPIGKELDSLADLVTFGVLPSLMLYFMAPTDSLLKFGVFVMAAAAAYRLAKFNLDTRQSEHFIGIPTPLNALVVASLPFIFEKADWLPQQSALLWILLGIAWLMSILMVSELPLLSLKFKELSWQGNQARFVFLGISLALVIGLQFVAVPLILVAYLLCSQWYFRSK